jgi:NAD(P)-dependent dehydrogenase (short-subunit alcohol dehydrogenase family)
MADKCGVVTAAGSGIGRASALAFAREGAKVMVSDLNEHKAQETYEMIISNGGHALVHTADASDELQVESLIEATLAGFGRIDFAHNNAGMSAGTSPVMLQEKAKWDKTLAVTLTGTMLCIKHELIAMRKQETAAAIICTVSNSGLQGQVGLSAYTAAKWGVIGLIRSAALENAKYNIRVNGISPGFTETPNMGWWAQQQPEQYAHTVASIPMQRPATPEDQAEAAVWLCSDRAQHITGIVLPVDGGALAGPIGIDT